MGGISVNDDLDATDVVTLATLRHTYDRLDPVPPDLAERCKFALTVQALHAEVAELTAESELVTRGQAPFSAAESVTFTSPTASLMITVTGQTDDTIRLDGWVSLALSRIEIRRDDGQLDVEADEFGRFSVPSLARGRAQFVVWPPGTDAEHRPVITPSIDL